ncbi:twitching mobility protein PilT [Gottschalkia acidurici 9a]|uniref:Twitching mobility protein PilT n=1 Tax=Gottschalkia acidurici (strain ATCC 7906 / DSM 604 / BCRC 14475 / CIP 104303 / KCTC 5404 / NCIMB 10678 / 9a) TaxID=1128398 RepID=K0B0W5_GOTA9|nr:PilT/PilU family type 4a pilus ATPase [Gottschalkia acidurici]AFS78286.1 twitching mobility protein PilT [Gottschalkia acidurici 9a]
MNKKILSIEELLVKIRDKKASDLHLTANMPPLARASGEIIQIDDEVLTNQDIKELVYSVLTDTQKQILEDKLSVDLAISVLNIGRFRVHVYHQRGNMTAVLRRLSDDNPDLKKLGLPKVVENVCELKSGLVLVTGATGSGKSTTLAAIIDRINQNYSKNIITIEDPIEYVHMNKKSIINQRELYTDVDSFPDALRGALRADPDIILVGEMRDLDTIRTAIMAAETGHLVFATLHSRDAVSSINRMIGVFTPQEQQQIRQQLSVSLKAVISQQLLPRKSGDGIVLACEIMNVTPAISNLIRLEKQEHMYMSIETGFDAGMQTMEQSLIQLVKSGDIDISTAKISSKNASMIEQRLNTINT